MAESIAKALEIPHIEVQWKSTKGLPSKEAVTINFYPDQSILSYGVAVVTKSMQWKNYVILYEDEDSLIKLQDVLKLTQRDGEPIIVRQITAPDYR